MPPNVLVPSVFVFDAYGTLYDTQSVSTLVDELYPGHGPVLSPIWRQKQLEYTWLLTCMGRYEPFGPVTRMSLQFALKSLGLPVEPEPVERLMDKYLRLDPFPDTREALRLLSSRPLAILTNGSRAMIDPLVRNTGMEATFAAVLSVDEVGCFKPRPEVYDLVPRRMGVRPDEVMFVSSNPFDVAGAKAAGFKVGWIRRGGGADDSLDAGGLYRRQRGRLEEYAEPPDHIFASLTDLAGLLG